MLVPHAVRLQAGPESRRCHSRRWSHGPRGGPVRTVTWAAFGLLQQPPCRGLEQGCACSRARRGMPGTRPGLREGSSRPPRVSAPPLVSAVGVTRAEDPCHLAPPPWVGRRPEVAPGVRSADAHRPREVSPEQGQIGRQVVVQRPGPVCIQKPRALGVQTRKETVF